MTPSILPEIEALIDAVRAEIRARRDDGQFLCYMSVPVSAKSGGDRQTNMEMAVHVAARLSETFGPKLWVLNPAFYDLPPIATGSDYMAVWSDVLAGPEGAGLDFDMAYFVGPRDVWDFFGAGESDRLGAIEAWLAAKAQSSPTHKDIYDDPSKRQGFIRYYGLRGSTIYSKGSHDEWNIVAALNAKRAIGETLAVYFNGQPIEPGDYQDTVTKGYQTILH